MRHTDVDAGDDRQGVPELVSDEELMQRVATREQAALGQLYQRYDLLLRKIISEKLCNAYDTEEVLQDVFIAVWNCASSYNPEHGKPLGWVVCMARRRAIDHLRKNRRHNANRVPQNWCENESDAVEDSLPCPQLAQENLIANRDLRVRLAGLIGELPAEQQHVVELAYFGDMSHRHIAAFIGIPLGTVKTRLELAINKLAKKSGHLREDL